MKEELKDTATRLLQLRKEKQQIETEAHGLLTTLSNVEVSVCVCVCVCVCVWGGGGEGGRRAFCVFSCEDSGIKPVEVCGVCW